MTTLTTEQSIELFRLISVSISKSFGWLAEDKKEDLATVAYIELCEYKPSVMYPDAMPNYTYIHSAVVHIAYDSKNYIAISGQHKAEKDKETMAEVLEKLNLDGEESRFNNSFREVSYEEYVEKTGIEVSCPSFEQEVIDLAERLDEEKQIDEWEMQVNAFKNAPMFNAILISAIAHVDAGGTFQSFADSMGYSVQTLKNHMKKRVAQANDPDNTFLPFAEYMFTDKPKVKKEPRPAKKTDNSVLQLTLF